MENFSDFIFDLLFTLFIFIVLYVLISVFSILLYEEKIDNYDITNAVLIDNFITYSRYGYPIYYLIYKFSDGSTKEFKVTSEQYYGFIK